MSKNNTGTKVFNGKRYDGWFYEKTKAEAEARARSIRTKPGHLARISKERVVIPSWDGKTAKMFDGYVVWVRRT